MKHVVIVNPDFAPSSLPPAQRVRLFARHLPEFGWSPTIVTAQPTYYESALDADNENLLPPDLRILRTAALPARWTRRVGFGDLGARCLWHHWRCLRTLVARERIDALLLPVPPFIPMILGRLLHQSHGVPYVVDYSDPWITDDWRKQAGSERLPKRALADRLARLLEPIALRSVSHIVGVSSGTTRMVTARYPWLSDRDTTEIPFGGEPDDLAWIREHPQGNRIFRPGDGLFHLTAVSACTPPMYPALRALFAAVSLGRSRDPNLFRTLRLHFVGSTYVGAPDDTVVLPLARELGVADIVDEHAARVTYLSSLQLLLDSDALLATGLVLPHYTASKIFPYLLAEKPLLALFHDESSATAILRQLRAPHLVTFGRNASPESRTEAVLQELVTILRAGPGQHVPLQRDDFEPHTARAMTRRLAKVLDGACRN